MRNHKLIGWVVGIPLLVILLILVIVFQEPDKEGISRAMAAKSVALALQSPDELKTWQKEYKTSFFPAETQKQWYVPYLDYLYGEGLLDVSEIPADEKQALQELTYREAAEMMGKLSPSLERLVRADKKNAEKPFPEEQWWLLYDSVLKKMDPEGNVRLEQVLIYATPETMAGTPAWTAHTNLGALTFYGLVLDPLADHQLKAYVRDSEMIHVTEDMGSDTVYRNVWILDGDENGLLVYVGDIERRIPFRKKTAKTEKLLNHMADLEMTDGKIKKVSLKTETITGKVLSVQEDAIELEGYGKIPLDSEYKVLKTYGGMERKELSDILVGYGTEEFVVAKGAVCGILISREFQAETIRVLIMNKGFQGLYHSTLTLVCSGPVKVIQGDKEKRLKAGEEFTIRTGDRQLRDGRLILEPETGGEITVRSLERAQGTPSYTGRMEIVEGEGGLVLVNELYLEDYLKRVVPSEMPSSYEKEALKAQAICARTYAYMQLQSNTYSLYGAHVDDSTNFQVYNNTENSIQAAEAVQDTYGKMLLYDGKPITAYYFSTSCGTTSDASVWGSDPESVPYLKSVALQPGRETLDLSSNEAFSAFIKNQDIKSYDSAYPFYRWNVTTSQEILSSNIDGVGTVTGLQITERGGGGVAKKLLVTGTEGEKTISGQNAIRAALGDESLVITKKDGKTVTGWGSLPSGFLTVEDAGNGKFQIFGGGFGHGAGMSQNGAQAMAKSGMKCEEILKFFYDGVSVEVLRQKQESSSQAEGSGTEKE